MINKIAIIYNKLKNIPGGKFIFSKLIGMAAPYSGTINAKIVHLSNGYAHVNMADRRKFRNHLNSIHAIALMNLAELTSGLSLLYTLPVDARGIVKGLSIKYFKKARGNLKCECYCNPPEISERKEYIIIAKIFDKHTDLVAQANACWLIAPKKNK